MSTFKTIASGLYSGKLKEVNFPTERVDHRRLSVDEIKQFVKEEFGKAKDAFKEKAKEKHWGDAEIAKELDWIKSLELKEYFERD